MTSTDESWTSWLCDLDAEDYSLISESYTRVVEGGLSYPNNDVVPTPQEENSENQLSYATFKTNNSNTMSNSSGDHNSSTFEKPSKALKTRTTSNIGYLSQKDSSSSSYILSFDNVNPEPILLNTDTTLMPKGALLKQMDKATVLRDTIKHVKFLHQQVKKLEEQAKRKRVESVVYVEKSKVSSSEDVPDSSSNSVDGDSNNDPSSKSIESLPEIEARVSEKNVLIRIQCKKQKGVLVNIVKVIENLHLSVINSSALIFGTSLMDITIIAEMDDEFSLSVKEFLRSLRMRLSQFK
ncbi:PREDICTED: transcription factor bHLH18-like [Lupinus angustifolius]|uniref:transcription factor bHLH18-like n=1 Tax=Lupinus angustifolius TaxID=3871 RepID=UPI00092E28BE|nr:PREDICTED: transcription factor bHLH18-like [Lupinus angustifolius]